MGTHIRRPARSAARNKSRRFRVRALILAATLLVPAFFSRSSSAQEQPLEIHAASSLTPLARRIGAILLAESGVRPAISGGSSGVLATRLLQGARGDVFLSADPRWIDRLRRAGRVDLVRPIARNRIVVALPATVLPQRAMEIRRLADLDTPRFRTLAIAAPAVPLGGYSRRVLANLPPNVQRRLLDRATGAASARQALEQVAGGHADAGLIYASDATGSSRVRVAFTPPDSIQPEIVAVGATLRDSKNPRAARAFLDLFRRPKGRAVLRDLGFAPPPETMPETITVAAQSPAAEPSGVSAVNALRTSLLVAAVALALALVPAVALAWVLARCEFFGKPLVVAVSMLPLVMPPVVTGVLLLSILGPGGAVGGFLENTLGLRVAFAFPGAAVAAAVVGFPLLLHATRLSIEAVDQRLEETARTLGDSPWRVFRRVTLPLSWPGVLAGCVLFFARAMGEFGATIVLAGDMEGRTRTLSLAMWNLLESPCGSRELRVLLWMSATIAAGSVLGYEWLRRRTHGR